MRPDAEIHEEWFELGGAGEVEFPISVVMTRIKLE
jgi:hypothetical protein